MLLLTSAVVGASEPGLSELRQAFLQAETAINENPDADYFKLAQDLKEYPLYPYLQYQWLKKHLDAESAVRQFLSDFDSSRYAKLLRHNWLLQLGKNQQWVVYMEFYRPGDDTELQCYFALAQYFNEQVPAALQTARQLWLSGKTVPDSCNSLFAKYTSSAEFTPDLVWQRFVAAWQAHNLPVATAMQALLPEPKRAEAELWLKLYRQPALLAEAADWKQNYAQADLLFASTIKLWLNQTLYPALAVWEAERHRYAIPDALNADIEKQIALELAFNRDPKAYQRLLQLPNQDNTTREWRVRAALNQQNWQEVSLAIAALTEAERRQEKWQYWQARALAGLGDSAAAQTIYQQLLNNRSFYALLAAKHLRQNLALNDKPLSIPAAEIDLLQQGREFQVTAELLALDRKPEAKRQWWYAVAGLRDHELLVAAKLAERWHWPAMAIFTLGKANAWDDMQIRFPLVYADAITDIANQLKLDPALLFGLIRQESGFDEWADSPVGAKGLMQLMPTTAQQIAQQLKENWAGDASLFNPLLNIKYGSYYYKQLLERFHGNHLLSAAAYNSGPNRVKRWQPNTQALPGDIWVETIPYRETRIYVASVMLYAQIYQQRLQRNPLQAMDLVTAVNPE